MYESRVNLLSDVGRIFPLLWINRSNLSLVYDLRIAIFIEGMPATEHEIHHDSTCKHVYFLYSTYYECEMIPCRSFKERFTQEP